MRALVMIVSAVWLAVLPAAPAQEPAAAPPKALRELESAAKELAKRGRMDELQRVLDALEAAGKPADAVDALRAAHMAVAAKVAAPARAKKAVRALGNAVKELDGWFQTLEGGAKKRAAALIVSLDSSHAAAQQALGRTEVDGRWVTGVRRMQIERRKAIARMLGEARVLDVPIEEDESLHEVLTAVAGAGGRAYHHGGFMMHTTVPREKALRILREALRAAAAANWIVTGELKVPEGDKVWVLLDGFATYRRSIDVALEKGWLTPKDAELHRDIANWLTAQNQVVFFGPTEAFAEVSMMDDILGVSVLEYAQPCIERGLGNWTGLAYRGAPLPGFVWIEREGGGRGTGPGRTTAQPSPREVAERKEHQRLAKAGIAGCKAWMAYLARRREDPPWSASFVDQRGKIQGDDRLKCTVVIEFLAERSPLQPVIAGTEEAQADTQARVAAFEKVLYESLSEFEERWRRWILPELDDGVLQRLAPGADGPPLSKADTETLAHLNAVRKAALNKFHPDSYWDLGLIESLSHGCRLHGEYLNKHPEQAQAWPDAHEEYPDREGFTPEGCRAAGASVIAPGSRGPTDAIDGWMATFYHRLPLLHPGLIKIGWGNRHGYACLDSGSMVGPVPQANMEVMWPPDKQTGVARRFAPELPNPVPGEDQAGWGYPVTLQFFAMADERSKIVTAMTLTEGKAGGEAVECWFISPEQPHNPEVAPAETYCLIPKQPLKAKTTYRVQAQLADRTLAWSFTTGR